MSEATLRVEVMRFLRSYPGVWAVKYHGGPYSEAGVPDILACVRGRFVAFELKMPGKKPTKIQEVQLGKIADAYGIAVVASSLDDVVKIVKDIEGQADRWK